MKWKWLLVVVCVFLTAANVPAHTEEPYSNQVAIIILNGQHFQLIYEWKSTPGWGLDGYIAASPDGFSLLRIGPEVIPESKIHDFQDATMIWMKDLQTGEDRLLAAGADGFSHISDISFAPDGKHLLFVAGGGTNDMAISYVYKFDITPTAAGFAIPITDGCYKERIKCAQSKPLYSPDGTKISLSVDTWEPDSVFMQDHKVIELKHIPIPPHPVFEMPPEPVGHPASYISLVPGGAIKQAPQRLVPGIAEFWSDDSKSIYYVYYGVLMRLDTETIVSTPVLGIDASYRILEKIPGKEAIIVSDSNKLKILALTPHVDIEPNLARALENIPVTDTKGRGLASIQIVGNRRIFLRYSGIGTQVGIPSIFHIQLLEY